MIRRLTALLLVFACAFALALPAHETEFATAGSCCCGDAPSTCGERDCAPPPAAPSVRVAPVVSAVEVSATAAKPAARGSRQVAIVIVSFFLREKIAAESARIVSTTLDIPRCRAPLFQAHCSLLI